MAERKNASQRSSFFRGKDFVTMERESAITTTKPTVFSKLTDLIENESDKAKFSHFCTKVDTTIRSWYYKEFEEFTELYSYFEPANGGTLLKMKKFSNSQIEQLEDKFLNLFFKFMEKSNFKLLTEQEYEIAKDGQYLLDLPIAVDTKNLDSDMLSRFLRKAQLQDVPGFGKHYLIFRRGVGMDRTSDLFINQKIDVIITRIWNFVLRILRLKSSPKINDKMNDNMKKDDENTMNADDVVDESLVIERLRLSNMHLSIKNLLSQFTIQEPTFSRIIVLYRNSSVLETTSPFKNRSIQIMHFRDIPFADMELVFPEKMNPGLSPMDWLKFAITAICGLGAIFGTLELKLNLAVVNAVIAALIGYFMKLYFAWKASIARYQNLIARSMYSKHLDSGTGTILHLQEQVIQQEVKEVVIAYFMLISTGKAQKTDLDKRCETLMIEEFGETVDFEVEDALQKLERMNIVKKNNLGFYVHLPLEVAETKIRHLEDTS